ncbi:MFS transporter [Trujillonella humicola]|uniref:MFS transporter n=1 Tax=Trujillonella humicola TaxID=3383699 RepID=UPI003905A92D
MTDLRLPAHPGAEPPGTGRPRRPTWAVVAVCCASGMVVALQQTLVVPLLPAFPRLLGTSVENASWLVTATLLTAAVATPTVGRLADMFGKRRMLLACLGSMVAGSTLAAMSTGFVGVVSGRALEGVGIALIPVGISILRDELPRSRVPGAVALMSATLGIGAAAGPALSGVLFDHLGWSAVFWTSAALGCLLVGAVAVVVPQSPVRTRGRFDVVGAALLSLALGALLLAITKGGSWGWSSGRVTGLLLGAACALAIWVPQQLWVREPVVDLRVSARRPVLFTNAATVLIGFAMSANMLTTTQQLQMPLSTGYGFGLSPSLAGLGLLPAGLAMVAMSPVSAALTRRYGPRASLMAGGAVLAGGYAIRAWLTDAVWQVVAGSAVVATGAALAYAAMPLLIMRSVPVTQTASANGLNALLRAIGTSSSSAAVGSVLASTTVAVGATTLPALAAFQQLFLLAGVASVAAVGFAALVPAGSPSAAEDDVVPDVPALDVATGVADGDHARRRTPPA